VKEASRKRDKPSRTRRDRDRLPRRMHAIGLGIGDDGRPSNITQIEDAAQERALHSITDTLVAVEVKMESGIGRLHTPPQLCAGPTRADALYFRESIHDLIDERGGSCRTLPPIRAFAALGCDERDERVGPSLRDRVVVHTNAR